MRLGALIALEIGIKKMLEHLENHHKYMTNERVDEFSQLVEDAISFFGACNVPKSEIATLKARLQEILSQIERKRTADRDPQPAA